MVASANAEQEILGSFSGSSISVIGFATRNFSVAVLTKVEFEKLKNQTLTVIAQISHSSIEGFQSALVCHCTFVAARLRMTPH